MRICMFTNTYLPHVGGVARSVSAFAQDLQNAGNPVLVVAPTYPGYTENDGSGTDVFRVPAIQRFNGSDFSVRIPSPFVLDERIDAFDPDIVHSHHPYLLGDAALRAARRRNLPLMFTHHTRYEEYAHYVAGDSERMKRFAAFLSTSYANLCDRVVAPSRSIRQLILERGVDVPVTIVPTGVDTAFFANGDGPSFRQRHDIPADAFVIGHLGRLAPEKNLAVLAAAVARALKRLPNARFLVVGDGTDRRPLEEIVAEAGVQDRLIMPGALTGKAVADAYCAMNLFAFASKTETQGMVLTEAMAAGVPVVAVDAPGVREVVQSGTNGKLLPDDTSVKGVADCLVRVAGNPDVASRWQKGARKTAEAFSRQRSTEALLSRYREAIDAKRRKSRPRADELDGWDKFLLACQAEWDLIAGKTESLKQTLDDDKAVAGIDAAD